MIFRTNELALRRTAGRYAIGWQSCSSLLSCGESVFFQFEYEARVEPISQLKAVRKEEFPLTYKESSLLVYLGLIGLNNWLDGTHLDCFTQSTDSNFNLIQEHCHRHTQKNVWPNAWAFRDLVNLMHIITVLPVYSLPKASQIRFPVWESVSSLANWSYQDVYLRLPLCVIHEGKALS